MYDRLGNFENGIKTLLLRSTVLHVDETGMKVNGSESWMHMASNKLLSHFGFHKKRGHEAIDSFNIVPLYNGTLIHDRFRSYFKYQCGHSLCHAHILMPIKG